MCFDGHGLSPGGTRSARVVIEESLWLCNGHIVEPVEIFGSGLPVAMRCFVLIHHHEWLVVVTLVFEPSECFLRDDLGGVSGMWSRHRLTVFSLRDHRRIVVGSLAFEHVVVIVSLRRGSEVPLADDGGLIAGGLQQFWKGLLVTIEPIPVANEPVEVTVFSCLR